LSNNEETIELWTLQHEEAYKDFLDVGRLTANENHLCFGPDDVSGWYAYQWYAKQMSNRVGPAPSGVKWPVWAWYKRYGKTGSEMGKPDMRESSYGERGTRVVRLKLAVACNRILLSDFDSWHSALNYWFLSLTKSEDDAFTEWCEQHGVLEQHLLNAGSKTESRNHAKVCQRIKESWERMFTLYTDNGEWHDTYERQSIQATLWELHLDDVVSAESFTLR
jgi:hypothetical protein